MKKNEALIKIQVYRILKLNKIIRVYRDLNKKCILSWSSLRVGGQATSKNAVMRQYGNPVMENSLQYYFSVVLVRV